MGGLRLRIAYNAKDFYSIYDDSGGYCYFGNSNFTAFSLVLRNVFGSLPHFWVRIFAIFMTIQGDIAISEPRILPLLAWSYATSSDFYRFFGVRLFTALALLLRKLFGSSPHLPYSYRSLFGFLPHLPYSYRSLFGSFPHLPTLTQTLRILPHLSCSYADS
jgi:hypothetical protein